MFNESGWLWEKIHRIVTCMDLTQGGFSLGVEQTPAAAAPHRSLPAAALAIHKYFVMREEMGYIRLV